MQRNGCSDAYSFETRIIGICLRGQPGALKPDFQHMEPSLSYATGKRVLSDLVRIAQHLIYQTHAKECLQWRACADSRAASWANGSDSRAAYWGSVGGWLLYSAKPTDCLLVWLQLVRRIRSSTHGHRNSQWITLTVINYMALKVSAYGRNSYLIKAKAKYCESN